MTCAASPSANDHPRRPQWLRPSARAASLRLDVSIPPAGGRRRASASRATSTSSNGCSRSPITWTFSWPLPATTTRSPASPISTARSMAARRSTIAIASGSEPGPVPDRTARSPRLRHPAHHLVDDGGGVLDARVVGRDDHDVAQPAGHCAHERALGAIAIASASEHGDHPSGATAPHGLEQVLECIVGVRVVDDHRDVVAGQRDDFEAPWYARRGLQCPPRSPRRQADRDTGRNRREDVVDVRSADQRRAHLHAPQVCELRTAAR